MLILPLLNPAFCGFISALQQYSVIPSFSWAGWAGFSLCCLLVGGGKTQPLLLRGWFCGKTLSCPYWAFILYGMWSYTHWPLQHEAENVRESAYHRCWTKYRTLLTDGSPECIHCDRLPNNFRPVGKIQPLISRSVSSKLCTQPGLP